ncbi:MAG: IS110 family transposase [Acidobacteria bacterium]|nr:IS110 family transposase [Acidobacteriota bacterium]
MNLHTIGIDLGKTSFHLVALSERGEVVVRKRFTRKQLLRFTANRSVQRIGMEACGGSHFLGRALEQQGHDVRLIPAQYVKPYVKTNKSDYIDAEAIAEAVGRPTMRFVPIKSDDQLDLQSLHRVRERWVMRRTAVVNQMRGLLLERGITIRKGRCHLEAALPGILEDAEANLSGALRFLLAQLKVELEQTAQRITEADAGIERAVRENEACQRLVTIPGIGPVTATAVIAAIGNGAAFHKGREFAAWVGLVPRQRSTGGQQRHYRKQVGRRVACLWPDCTRRRCFEEEGNTSGEGHNAERDDGESDPTCLRVETLYGDRRRKLSSDNDQSGDPKRVDDPNDHGTYRK